MDYQFNCGGMEAERGAAVSASAISWAQAELFDLHTALKLKAQALKEQEAQFEKRRAEREAQFEKQRAQFEKQRVQFEKQRADFDQRRTHWQLEVDRRVQDMYDAYIDEHKRKGDAFDSLQRDNDEFMQRLEIMEAQKIIAEDKRNDLQEDLDAMAAERKGLRQKVGQLENRLSDLHAAMVSLRKQQRSSSSGDSVGEKGQARRSRASSLGSRPSPARSTASSSSSSASLGSMVKAEKLAPVMQLVSALMQVTNDLGSALVRHSTTTSGGVGGRGGGGKAAGPAAAAAVSDLSGFGLNTGREEFGRVCGEVGAQILPGLQSLYPFFMGSSGNCELWRQRLFFRTIWACCGLNAPGTSSLSGVAVAGFCWEGGREGCGNGGSSSSRSQYLLRKLAQSMVTLPPDDLPQPKPQPQHRRRQQHFHPGKPDEYEYEYRHEHDQEAVRSNSNLNAAGEAETEAEAGCACLSPDLEVRMLACLFVLRHARAPLHLRACLSTLHADLHNHRGGGAMFGGTARTPPRHKAGHVHVHVRGTPAVTPAAAARALFCARGGARVIVPLLASGQDALVAGASSVLLALVQDGEHLSMFLSSCANESFIRFSATLLQLGVLTRQRPALEMLLLLLQRLSTVPAYRYLFEYADLMGKVMECLRSVPALHPDATRIEAGETAADWSFFIMNAKSIISNLSEDR